MKNVLFLAALLFGCHHKQADTTEPTGPTIDTSPHPSSGGGDIIPPEKMDEVQTDLSRRQMIISRCLATAMENQEVKHGTHGHITFEIRIGTSGSAESVKVIKTDIDAKSVLDCATKHVQDTGFPTLPKAYETSYTYAIEAN
ncbi:MAG TPA: hypothetical protein VFQ65_00740 [Kofleriaceae bacterium]|nr:hypothetical protein [Kofleriaceae bacterium]